MIRSILLSILFFSFTNTVYAAGTEGGGSGLILQMALNESVINPGGFDVITEDFMSGIALGMTQFDDARAAAVYDAFNADIAVKVQDYYTAQMANATPNEVARKAIEASVLNMYGGYTETEALDTVIFEPEFSSIEFQDIMGIENL